MEWWHTWTDIHGRGSLHGLCMIRWFARLTFDAVENAWNSYWKYRIIWDLCTWLNFTFWAAWVWLDVRCWRGDNIRFWRADKWFKADSLKRCLMLTQIRYLMLTRRRLSMLRRWRICLMLNRWHLFDTESQTSSLMLKRWQDVQCWRGVEFSMLMRSLYVRCWRSVKVSDLEPLAQCAILTRSRDVQFWVAHNLFDVEALTRCLMLMRR